MMLAILAAAASPNPEWNCKDPVAQQEMNWCAAQEFHRADVALNAQWSKTAAVMKKRDSQLDRADKSPRHFDTLLKAQRAWLQYRDAHCAGAGFQFRGGSMEPLIVATCRTRLTQDRTQQLNDLIGQ